MQVNDTAKIKSAPKSGRLFNFRLVFVVVAVCILAGIILVGSRRSPAIRTLRLDRQSYRLEVADNDKVRAKGLGGRHSMPKDRGMLFVFDQPERSCFWMKDMQFAIDIIWTDKDGKVLHIVPSLPPDSYPQDYCTPEPAKYVIELVSGQAAAHKIQVGEKLDF